MRIRVPGPPGDGPPRREERALCARNNTIYLARSNWAATRHARTCSNRWGAGWTPVRASTALIQPRARCREKYVPQVRHRGEDCISRDPQGRETKLNGSRGHSLLYSAARARAPPRGPICVPIRLPVRLPVRVPVRVPVLYAVASPRTRFASSPRLPLACLIPQRWRNRLLECGGQPLRPWPLVDLERVLSLAVH